MRKFIYVFSQNKKEELLSKGYYLMKEDAEKQVYVFANDERFEFQQDADCVTSDILTF